MSALVEEVKESVSKATKEESGSETHGIGGTKSLGEEGIAEKQAIPILGTPGAENVVATDDKVQPKGDAGSEVKKEGQVGHRLLVLLHGEKAADALVRAAIQRLRSEGHEITVRVTYEAGDVDRLVGEAVALKTCDTLVAAGGDGTVNEVTAALLRHTGGLRDTYEAEVGGVGAGAGRDVAQGTSPAPAPRATPTASTPPFTVGILPMGTSNDFAATTGIPQDPYDALKLMTRPETAHPIDVGLLNGQVFMNTATIGASADVGKITSSGLKRLLGPAAFLFTGARAAARWGPVDSDLHFPDMDLGEEQVAVMKTGEIPEGLEAATSGEGAATLARTLSNTMHANESKRAEHAKEGGKTKGKKDGGSKDGDAALAGKAGVGRVTGVPLLHLTAANNRQIASMVAVAPSALLDDGLLDCVYLTGTPKDQVMRMLRDTLRKGLGRARPIPTLMRLPWLEVECASPLEWSLDGEPAPEPSTHFRFSLLHAAVRVHLPDNRMLVAGNMPEAGGQAVARKRGGVAGTVRRQLAKLRPGPTMAELMGSVVRFRKKKNWGAALRSFAGTVVKTALVASAGGLLVHRWHVHNARNAAAIAASPDADASADKGKAATVKEGVKTAKADKKKNRELLGRDGRGRPPTTRPLPVA